MGGVLFFLFSVVLYTRMWKTRYSSWDYLYAGTTMEEEMEAGNVTFLSFKGTDLIQSLLYMRIHHCSVSSIDQSQNEVFGR
jgi:hypothetical protein